MVQRYDVGPTYRKRWIVPSRGYLKLVRTRLTKAEREIRDAKIQQLYIMGYGCSRISKMLECSKSTVSAACGPVPVLSDEDKARRAAVREESRHLAVSTAAQTWAKKRRLVIELAAAEWPSVRADAALMAFLGLYLGEGGKSIKSTKLANNDPRVIALAFATMRRWAKPDRIMVDVVYYPSHEAKKCEEFWRLALPGTDPKLRPNIDRRSKPKWCDRCPHGRCTLTLNDYTVYWRIMTWIDLWLQETVGELPRISSRAM